jgi:hypothetical protein
VFFDNLFRLFERRPLVACVFEQIRDKGLQQLLDDKELSVLAGITVPPTGAVTVFDDINGVNSIVQNGFAKLLGLWEQSSRNPPDELKEAFSAMGSLGAKAQPLLGLDQKIQSILSAAAPATKAVMSAPAELPSEEAIVQ